MENVTSEGGESVTGDADLQKTGDDSEMFGTDARIADDVSLEEMEYEVLWQNELEGDINTELTNMTKQDYFHFCRHFHDTLQTLLADENTSIYAVFSLLFKKFRNTYVLNQKLLCKVHEIEGVKRFLEGKRQDLLEKLDKRDAQERELKHSYMTIRNAIADTIRQKNDVERQRDDLKRKLSQIPEELIKAAAESSLISVSEERKLLLSQLEEMKEKMETLQQDLERAQTREGMFRSKYQEAKMIQASFMDEIRSFKKELVLQTERKDNAELAALEKSQEAKKHCDRIKQLKNDISKLKIDRENEKEKHNRTIKELQKIKKSIADYKQNIDELKKDLSARHFQIAVLRIHRKNTEIQAQRDQTHIHSLKVGLTKVTKERDQLFKNLNSVVEDFKNMKCEYEKSSATVKKCITEIENLQGEKHLIENDYKETMRQMMKTDYEFRLGRQTIKELESEMKILKIEYESLSKELDIKTSQLEELKRVVVRNRGEKNNMVKEMAENKVSMTDSQHLIKALEQRCAEYECKIFNFKEQIQSEKEKYQFLNDVYREVTNRYRSIKRELENTEYLNSTVSMRTKNQIVHIRSLQERHDKLEKQITLLKVDIKSARSAQTQQEVRCSKLSEEAVQKEKEKLLILKDVSQKELELKAVKRDLNNFACERELLKSQLEQKANEVKIKEEKIRLQQQDLTRVEQMLQDRISDVKFLKTEVETLRRTESILRSQKNNTDSLREEINSIHRQLMNEKLKSKTMEEEFQKPQNIHRWRILESEDPTRAHLIARNLKFQKDLVKKTDKLKVKEQELQHKNQLVAELQQDLKKLTAAQSEVDTWTWKIDLRQCKERIKCLTAEIAMYESLTSKQEIENKELRDEINKLKSFACEKKLPPITAGQ